MASTKVLSMGELLDAATSIDNKFSVEERDESSAKLMNQLVNKQGLALAATLREIKLVEVASATLVSTGKTTAVARTATANLLNSLLTSFGKMALPLLLPAMTPLLELLGDKVKGPRVAAQAPVDQFMSLASRFATTHLLPRLLVRPEQWMANKARLDLITSLCKVAPDATARQLGEILPLVAEDLHDVKGKVQDAARACVTALCALCTNEDVVPLVPTLMEALEDGEKVDKCVQKLASSTFVQEVDGPTLSIMSPILVRGFATNASQISKRSSARIVENMVKLVEEPADLALAFLPKILPRLQAASVNVTSAEARKVCDFAANLLVKRATLKKGQSLPGSPEEMLKLLTAEIPEAKMEDEDTLVFAKYTAELLSTMVGLRVMEKETWDETLLPILRIIASKPELVVERVLELTKTAITPDEEEEEVEEGTELCNCEFTLAYGNKVLLKKTKLRLMLGQNYGLIGKNDSGKTSLMRAIADHRVEGFPDEDTLRTVFVETDIKVEFADLTVIDYIMNRQDLADKNIPREKMIETLQAVGFNKDSPADVVSTVGQLSGGWRMKLALAGAMLLNADILLLDEPTNHLDSYNVKWVEEYLQGLDNVTCVMVSHDSGFLNRICNNIVQIEDFRLSYHKGNLESFVAKNPDAKSFFELKTEKFAFKFPQPNRLKGINSKGKPIMKMTDISFTYPGAAKAQLNHVTIQVSLGSRVACVGVNGAGKSTMIKLLTGELEPDEGSGNVWTHPNMLYGYIAQHAFHHIESHLEKTPNEYIRWRYRYGNDREALNKVTNVVSEEEQKQMDKPVRFEIKDRETGLQCFKTGVIKKFTQARRVNKQKKCQEYEVQLVGDEQTNTTYWVARPTLEKAGWEKVLKTTDDAITMRESMFQNPLTKNNVTKHLDDVGLEEEFSTHMPIGALSGGQKVKVVLGAALWNRPHVLILDEPTNYLDRDSLGALAAAIREFEGGVVMITHNSQFCDNLCPQVWHLENNTLNVKGDAEWMQMDMKLAEEKVESGTTVDKYGNTVEIKRVYALLPKKEQKQLKKKREKARKQCIKAGGNPEELEFDDGFEWDEF